MKPPRVLAVVLAMLLAAYGLFFLVKYASQIFRLDLSYGMNFFTLAMQTFYLVFDVLFLMLGLVFLLSPSDAMKEKAYRYLRFIFTMNFLMSIPSRIYGIFWYLSIAEALTWGYLLNTGVTLAVSVTATVLFLKNKPDRPIQNINLSNYELVAYTSTGHRFVHYLVDFLYIIPIIFSWSSLIYRLRTDEALLLELIVILIWFFYYFLSEAIFKQTLGKMMTNSCVVSNGPEYNVGRALVRTLCRLIPFDGISFLFRGNWHDKASSTSVVYVDTWQKVFEEPAQA